jgi:hypothetical protein
MRCQNTVRSSTLWGSVAHGAAAVYCSPLIVRGVAAMVGSELCTIFGSPYVPGTLALIGSP